MRNSIKVVFCLLFVVITSLNFPKQVLAVELIVNGGFENATAFFGWTTVNSPSPWRFWSNSGAGGGGGFTSVAVTSVAPGGGGTKNAWQGMTDNVTTNSQWQLYQSVAIPAGQAALVTWKDRYQVNHTSFCPSGTCNPKFYFVEITNAAGTTVLKTLHTQSTIGNVNQDTGWVSRSSILPTSLSGQTVRLRFRGTETTPLSGPGQIEIDLVSMNTFVPTAANAIVSGRVTTLDGRGISRTRLTITDTTNGEIRYASTNPFGYYNFGGLETGRIYIVAVTSKRYIFQPDTQTFQLDENLDGVNFTGTVPDSR